MLIIFESILWTSIGALLYRQKLASTKLPSLIAKCLYWVGVPLQIFFLARKSDFGQLPWIPSLAAIILILLALALTLSAIELLKRSYTVSIDPIKLLPASGQLSILNSLDNFFLFNFSTAPSFKNFVGAIKPKSKNSQGSFVLSSILGNTGFIGLTIVPLLVDQTFWSWILLYGVAHNILGSYGVGAVIAENYSCTDAKSSWWNRVQSLLFLPSLWAFAYGYASRGLAFPHSFEVVIAKGILFIVPGAFLLIGMQLSRLQSLQSIKSGIIPSIIKMIVLPGLAGLLLTAIGLQGEGRLALVLMSGMPTAFASIILAEEYDLDRKISANSILLSTLFVPITIPLWIAIF